MIFAKSMIYLFENLLIKFLFSFNIDNIDIFCSTSFFNKDMMLFGGNLVSKFVEIQTSTKFIKFNLFNKVNNSLGDSLSKLLDFKKNLLNSSSFNLFKNVIY